MSNRLKPLKPAPNLVFITVSLCCFALWAWLSRGDGNSLLRAAGELNSFEKTYSPLARKNMITRLVIAGNISRKRSNNNQFIALNSIIKIKSIIFRKGFKKNLDLKN